MVTVNHVGRDQNSFIGSDDMALPVQRHLHGTADAKGHLQAAVQMGRIAEIHVVHRRKECFRLRIVHIPVHPATSMTNSDYIIAYNFFPNQPL